MDDDFLEDEPRPPADPLRRLAAAVVLQAVRDYANKSAYDPRVRMTAKRFLFPEDPACRALLDLTLHASGIDGVWLKRCLSRRVPTANRNAWHVL